MGLSRRSKATITRANSNVRGGAGSSRQIAEVLLPPFAQGVKVGASGIGAMDVPAMKICYQLLEGLSLVRGGRCGTTRQGTCIALLFIVASRRSSDLYIMEL